MSQDSWRGLLTAPQTAGRYAYVINNPTSLVDANGNEPYRPSQFTGATHPTNMGAPGTGGIAGDAPPARNGGGGGGGKGSPSAGSGGSKGCVPAVRKACSKDETTKKTHKTEANPCANLRHCTTGGPNSTFPPSNGIVDPNLRTILTIAAGIVIGVAAGACIIATAGICAGVGVLVGSAVAVGAGAAVGTGIVAVTPGGHEASDYIGGAISGGVGSLPIPIGGAVAVSAAQTAKEAALLAAANAARDGKVVEVMAGNAAGRPATVVGAYNAATGEVAAGVSSKAAQQCAEACALELLGGNPADVFFTTAVRPTSGKTIPVCVICEGAYGRDAFPDPLTQFSSGR